MKLDEHFCVGATRGSGRISNVIAWVTAPFRYILTGRLEEVSSHVFVKFPNSFGDKCCFESRFKTGWEGPLSYTDFIHRLNADPKRRMWLIPIQDLTMTQIEELWIKATIHVGIHPYAHSQLGLLYLRRRLRIPFNATPGTWICSEGVGRLLRGFKNVCRMAGVKKEDYLTPFNVVRGLVQSGYPLVEIERDPEPLAT